ncbi:MAG: hypothetical protein JRN35_06740 [Nitrososphaerota archaeon]|nr:hypothetical protein [Nitrososphaerota archaeon]MDG7017623.1 hypothetical protein [Nitrososphaerota archaeon]MDG7029633.1 hypothetical protein [Nitrososphaerota archaeon]
MSADEAKRSLAAVMITDIVGYTEKTQRNESLAMSLLEEHRKVLREAFGKHVGMEVKTMGDAFLVKFQSALAAVRCAYEIQRSLREFNAGRDEERRVVVRIGLHMGDVIEEGHDIYGDAVNVASRIEPLADPGGVCLTRQVYDQVQNKFELPLASLGTRTLKNVRVSLEIYKIIMPWEESASSKDDSVLPRGRIAILPFVSFSPDPNDVYFADGITDEIISTVAGISGLSVISRTSVMGYKGTTKKVWEIGKELGVGTILEGSLKKAGNRIRVTAQLIDAATDRHLWAQNYDKDLDDVFEVQSDIAKRISDALSIRILAPEVEQIDRRPTRSAEAYSLYLKGRYLWNKRRLEDLKGALEYFDRAVAEDPDFALGYVGKADCQLLLRNNFGIEPKMNLESAKRMVARALGLDPELAEAHATRGLILQTEFEPQEAEQEFRKAIELKPSYATAHHWYFFALRSQYRWKEALSEIERAVELDPLSPVIIGNYAGCLFDLGRTQEAVRQLESADKLGVLTASTLAGLAMLHLYLGRQADAAACLERASKVEPGDLNVLEMEGFLEYLGGNHSRAKAVLERGMEEGAKWSAYAQKFVMDLVILYSKTGEREKALEGIAKLEAMPEEMKYELAYKGRLLAVAYAAVGDAERFFRMYERMIKANMADVRDLRLMPLIIPQADLIYKDHRWADLLNSVGLEDIGKGARP